MVYSSWPLQLIFRSLVDGLLPILVCLTVFRLVHTREAWQIKGSRRKTGLKVAFATLLLPEQPVANRSNVLYLMILIHIVSTRILNYQLRWPQKTRSSSEIPFLVMVTEGFLESQMEILTKEGAQVLQIEMVTHGSD